MKSPSSRIPKLVPSGDPKKASARAARAAREPTFGSVASDLSASITASVTASVAKEASEGQRKDGRGASARVARAPTVGSIVSDSSSSVTASVTKEASDGRKKDGRGREERKQRAARRAQGRETETSPPLSVDAVASSPSSWAAVAASPASVSARVPRERISPVKRASARQVVSQSPGRWTSNPWPKTTRDARRLIVAGIAPTLEGTPDIQSQPRRREETETGPSLKGTPETQSMVSQHESKQERPSQPPPLCRLRRHHCRIPVTLSTLLTTL